MSVVYAAISAGWGHKLCYLAAGESGNAAMASDVSRDEFHHLEARVTVVEQEVEGEKMVTRHILEQSRRNGHDLADFKNDMADFKKQTGERFDRLERRFDNLEGRFDNLEGRFDKLERKVDTLRKDIPSIVGEVMRDVLRERDREC
jgi:predicted  nucleic acid-binding Zn-ribbon protein